MATYAAWARPWQTLQATFSNPQFNEQLVQRLGLPKTRELLDLLKIATHQKKILPTTGQRKLSAAANFLSLRQLAFSPSVWFQNRFLGKEAIASQLTVDGNDNAASRLRRTWSGFKEYKLSASEKAELAELEKISGFLGLRWRRSQYTKYLGDLSEYQDAAAADVTKASKARQALADWYETLSAAAASPMVIAEQKNALETYRALKAEGWDAAEAARYVEKLTRYTQNPSDVLDSSDTYMLLQEHPLIRLFLPFLGQATTTHLNLRRNIVNSALKQAKGDLSKISSKGGGKEDAAAYLRLLRLASKDDKYAAAVFAMIIQIFGAATVTAGIALLRGKEKEVEKGRRLTKEEKRARKAFMFQNLFGNILDNTVPGSGKVAESIISAYGAVEKKQRIDTDSLVAPSLLASAMRDVSYVSRLLNRKNRRKPEVWYNGAKLMLSELLPVRGIFGAGELGVGAMKGFGDMLDELDKEAAKNKVE
jgi:hypothetical protein